MDGKEGVDGSSPSEGSGAIAQADIDAELGPAAQAGAKRHSAEGAGI
jgi:hypothetical protein